MPWVGAARLNTDQPLGGSSKLGIPFGGSRKKKGSLLVSTLGSPYVGKLHLATETYSASLSKKNNLNSKYPTSWPIYLDPPPTLD